MNTKQIEQLKTLAVDIKAGTVVWLNKTKEKKLIEILNILDKKEKETLDSIGENNGNKWRKSYEIIRWVWDSS